MLLFIQYCSDTGAAVVVFVAVSVNIVVTTATNADFDSAEYCNG